VSAYTPMPFELGQCGSSTTQPPRCGACGQRAYAHEDGGRCYTPLELEAAWRFLQRARRWPVDMLAPLPEETP
jgi:hypothetical protein